MPIMSRFFHGLHTACSSVVIALVPVLLPFTAYAQAPAAEQLIVFTQPTASPLAERFESDALPQLRKLAVELGVELVTIDVSQRGAPEAVKLTPLIAFQNHLGRSVYQGRYETLDRVRNFVRTARFMPQGEELLEKSLLPVRKIGRTSLAAPIKITALGGAQPDSFDADAFNTEMIRSLASAMPGFTLADRVTLGRSDRLFYADFHPYRADDGTLYVSTELYSQFHCHEPVWSGLQSPAVGQWDKRAEVFAQAAQQLAQEIDAQLATSTLGDGFDALGAAVPVVSWESLGLPLPPKPQGAAGVAVSVALVSDWVIDTAAQHARPAVQFAFPAPLDGYAGEVARITGTLTLGSNLTLANSTGRFVADPATVTMGEPDLDDAIHSTMLMVDDHPEATFELLSVEASDAAMSFNTVTPAILVGRFTMKGISIDLTVPASVEAVVNADGSPRIILDAAWPISLKDPFNIDGPPGPKEASDTLRYTAHLAFKPAQ